jgi:hypothetical protein
MDPAVPENSMHRAKRALSTEHSDDYPSSEASSKRAKQEESTRLEGAASPMNTTMPVDTETVGDATTPVHAVSVLATNAATPVDLPQSSLDLVSADAGLYI